MKEIIIRRLSTACWAAFVASVAGLASGQWQGVFFAYVIFDAVLSCFYLPSLWVGRQREDWMSLLFTLLWISAAWWLAAPVTRAVFY